MAEHEQPQRVEGLAGAVPAGGGHRPAPDDVAAIVAERKDVLRVDPQPPFLLGRAEAQWDIGRFTRDLASRMWPGRGDDTLPKPTDGHDLVGLHRAGRGSG